MYNICEMLQPVNAPRQAQSSDWLDLSEGMDCACVMHSKNLVERSYERCDVPGEYTPSAMLAYNFSLLCEWCSVLVPERFAIAARLANFYHACTMHASPLLYLDSLQPFQRLLL